MTTKLPRKLLSCLLVLAICITTVFGCLMTVSAATASYEFGSGSVNEELTEATIDVTFTPPTDVAALADGTYMAEFMLNEVDTDGLVLQSVAVEAIAPGSISLDTIGLSYNSEGLADGEIAYIVFDSATAFTSVKLKLTFGFAGGTAVKGNEYKMSINSVTYTGRYEGDTYTETASANGVIKTGCDHIITVDEADLIKTDSVNGYSVYSKSLCSICGEEFDYQVVPTAVPGGKVVYWDGTYHNGATSFEGVLDGSGSETDPYIIDGADDLALVVRGSVATTNKHFKVADGIDAIVLQKEAYAQDIMSLKTSENVRSYFEGDNIPESDLLTWTNGGWDATNKFAGFFDGNGATIYGLYCDKSTDDYTVGLFGKIDTSADNKTITFKNITLKNAYMKALTLVGGIVACANSSNGITLEGCTVANSYIRHYMSQSTANPQTNKASVMASRWAGTITVNNCLVYGNDALNVAMVNAAEDCTGYPLSMITNTDVSMSNVVCLGTTPYDKYGSSYNFVRLTTSPFSNVYTDQPVDEYTYYLNGDTKAITRIGEKMSSALQNSFTAATMAEVKTQDFVTTFNEHAGTEVLAVDVNGGYPTFAKEVAKIEESGTTNTWAYNDGDGSWSDDLQYDNVLADNGEKGDSWDTAIIIDNAEELAWLATRESDKGTEGTAGKYYKVADGITAFNMNPNVDLSGDMTAAEVELTITNPKSWWNATFEGNFDGNGVTIYGLCANYGNNVGLFPNVKGNVTIKNVTVKNSYFYGDSVGVFYGYNNGATVTLENCVAHDNVVVSTRVNDANSYGGVVGGASSGVLFVNNCLVYDNTAKHETYNIEYGLFGGSGSYTDTDGNTVYGKIENSIILGTLPHAISYSWSSVGHFNYSNIYSDKLNLTMTTGEHPCNVDTDGDKVTEIVQCYNTTTTSIDETTGKVAIKAVRHVVTINTDYSVSTTKDAGSFIATTADDVTGLAAESVVTALNTANGDKTVWSATANGYPTPLTAYADTINSVSSIDLALEAVNLTYNNDGSFNLNFHYEPAYSGFAPEVYVAQADLSGFMKLEAKESSMAGNGLSADALMYVIENLSAREIGDTLLPTVVAASGNTALWGKTEQMSIADYAVAVINGEAVYTEDADETVKQQDKNVAAAVINYGEAAKAALTQGYDGNAAGGTTIYWDGTTSAPADSDGDGVYEITKASELAYIAENTNSDTAGSTYKVADDIGTIVLQPESTIDNLGGLSELTGLSNADDVQKYYEGNASSLTQWVAVSDSSAYNAGFAGTFDGNGATIYGMYRSSNGGYGGLFSAAGELTVQNVTLKNNYVYGDAAAVICAQTKTSGNFTVNNTVIANNVVIASRKDDAMTYGGVMFGVAGYGKLLVDNCLVYGNIAVHSQYSTNGATNGTGTKHHEQEYDITYGLWGSMNRNDSTQNTVISNSIILDTAPYAINHSWAGQNQNTYTNVYTNMTGMTITNTDWASTGTTSKVYKTVTTINSDGTTKIEFYAANSETVTYTFASVAIYKVDHADVLGSAAATNCPDLDWNTWAYGMSGEYPTPITSATADAAGRIEYWDGTYASSIADDTSSTDETKGTSENPIIINSAEELALLVRTTEENTFGKNYKIADDIDAIILQPETVVDDAAELMSLDSAADVQKYFEDKIVAGVTPKDWHNNYVWTGIFNGNFDGNGVEIYGLYSNSDNAALFFMVDGGGETLDDTEVETFNDGGITIKNLAIKNSYLISNNRLGAIVGQAYGSAESATAGARVDGVINIDSCVVANCYMRETAESKHDYAGIITGDIGSDLVNINNCLVCGNDAQNTYLNLGLSLRANGAGNRTDADGNTVFNKVTNTIVLGSTPYPTSYYRWVISANACFDNVYTDQAVGSVTLPSPAGGDPSTQNYTNITNVVLSDMLGDKAQSIVDAINAANGESRDMYVGNAWGYPSFEKAGIMPAANQMAFDALTMSNYDDYTATDLDFSMYATSLNLKTNPYIAFTFAFNKDYKANRSDITVTFKNEAGTVIKQTTVADENGNLNAGWTNNEGAGRYHLYRLTDVAVEDLCKDITVTVTYGKNDPVEFGKFSVEGFALDIQNAYKQDPCQYYATRVEAAKALLYYTQMVNARYGSVA